MEAIVLAGGLGTRLRQTVPDLPKPMAPVAGRPFLEILLSSLAKKKFTRIILSLGFMAEKVVEHFGDSYLGMELVYEVEEIPLGTGGAVRAAMERCVSDHVFVFNGDTYLDLEVDAVEEVWISSHRPVMVVREVANAGRFGKVDIFNGRVQAFLEKGGSGPGLINAGCYVLPTNALCDFSLKNPFSLEAEFFEKSLRNIWLNGFVTHGLFIDIGVPDDYAYAQTALSEV